MPQVAGCAVRGKHPGPCGWGCVEIGEAALEQEMSTWAPLTERWGWPLEPPLPVLFWSPVITLDP